MKTNFRQQIGAEITRCRKELKINVPEFAKLLKTSKRNIYDWERGEQNITADSLAMIAKRLKKKIRLTFIK